MNNYPYGYVPPNQPVPNGYMPAGSWGYPPQGNLPANHASVLQQPQPPAAAPAYYASPSQMGHPRVVIPQRSPQYSHQPQQHQIYTPQHPQQFAPAPQSQSYQVQPQHVRQHPQVIIQPSPRSNVLLPNAVAPNQPESPRPVDYQILLLSLAEEYVAAARGMGSLAALEGREEEQGQYYKLMATGLSCMESVLLNIRQHPRAEAILRLRYAGLLYDETTNYSQAESVLSKGIALCQRNKLMDLQYSMHHLLARVMYKTNPKAALKYLDNIIGEAEAYQHGIWVYALRFLRVSLSLRSSMHLDVSAALQNLQQILALSGRRGDMSIYVTAATLEAMVNLRSTSMDRVEQAQRAIAAARSLQLQISTHDLSQVIALLDFIDLACCLQQHSPDLAVAKMQSMQATMDDVIKDSNDTGVISIPIERSGGGPLTTLTGGIFEKRRDGYETLTFSWLPKSDLYALGYYLSGVTAFLKGPAESKTSQYLQEGARVLDAMRIPQVPDETLSVAAEKAEWRILMDWFMRLHITFVHCAKAEWEAARQSFDYLLRGGRSIRLEPAESIMRLTTYLAGVIDQGSGEIESALQHYQSPILALPPHLNRASTAQHDICILAALNSLLIIHNAQHPQHPRIADILPRVESVCLSHPNKAIVSAFYLTKATTNNMASIVKTKQCLQLALQAAKATANQQLLSISMNLMTAAFFTDIMGEQAEKSAKAGRQLARRCKDEMWLCVADGMLVNTLERHGKADAALEVRQELASLYEKLPAPLKRAA